MLFAAKSWPVDVDYKILKGAKAVGNAVEAYGFSVASPYMKPMKMQDNSEEDKSSQ